MSSLKKHDGVLIKLLATLLYLKKYHNFEIVYSDIHLQELGMTGYKADFSKEDRDKLIKKDLDFIKTITSSRRIYRNAADGLFYVHDVCPTDQFKNISSVPFFLELLTETINLFSGDLLAYSRTSVGLGPIILNNCKNKDEAQEKINKALFSNAMKSEKNIVLDEKIKQESELLQNKTNALIQKTRDLFVHFINDILSKNPDLKTIVEPLIEKFELQIEESLQNIKTVDYSSKATVTSSKLNIEELLSIIQKESGIVLSQDAMERSLRNTFGYLTKPIKVGATSDYFDVQHADYLEVSSFFITNEHENFRKRFSEHGNKIFKANSFLDFLKNKCKIDVKVNLNDEKPLEDANH